MDSALPRPLTEQESDLLTALLSHDFAGVEALRVQTRGLLARSGCGCGCGTLDLIPQGEGLPRSSASSPTEVSGHVIGSGGESIGGVVLFLTHGLLASLEVYSYDEPIPLPDVRSVEWQL